MEFTTSGSDPASLVLTDETNTYTVSAGTDDDFGASTYNILDESDNVVGTITFDATAATSVANANAVDFASIEFADNSVVLQTGSNQGDTLSVQIGNMSAGGLGIIGSDVSTRETASSAITTVEGAINAVSTQRAHLGALQNRLEHKINNLDTSAENLQSAESRIRDVDMASRDDGVYADQHPGAGCNVDVGAGQFGPAERAVAAAVTQRTGFVLSNLRISTIRESPQKRAFSG